MYSASWSTALSWSIHGVRLCLGDILFWWWSLTNPTHIPPRTRDIDRTLSGNSSAALQEPHCHCSIVPGEISHVAQGQRPGVWRLITHAAGLVLAGTGHLHCSYGLVSSPPRQSRQKSVQLLRRYQHPASPAPIRELPTCYALPYCLLGDA